jgi:RNA polymerase sigma factor for flagellar operon FliA
MSADLDAQLAQLAAEHAPLVRQIARAMASRLPSNVEADDLIQVGMIGLLGAVTRYDPDQGVPFGAFARQCIRGAMIDELRRGDWAPRGLRTAQKNVAKVTNQLQHQLGRKPRDSEVAHARGVTLSEHQSQQAEVYSAQHLCIDDVMVEAHEQPAASPAPDHDALTRALERLPRQKQRMLAMRYQEERTAQEIGLALNLSPAHVNRVILQVLAWLREQLQKKAIDPIGHIPMTTCP